MRMMKKDRKGSLLVSSLCSFISADAIHDIDIEHWKFIQFGLRCGNYNFGFRVQGEMSVWQLDI